MNPAELMADLHKGLMSPEEALEKLRKTPVVLRASHEPMEFIPGRIPIDHLMAQFERECAPSGMMRAVVEGLLRLATQAGLNAGAAVCTDGARIHRTDATRDALVGAANVILSLQVVWTNPVRGDGALPADLEELVAGMGEDETDQQMARREFLEVWEKFLRAWERRRTPSKPKAKNSRCRPPVKARRSRGVRA